MAELGLPFRGTLWYWEEASYGGGESGTTYAISCKILDARPGIMDKHKVLRGIDRPCACELLEQATDVVFHLEYIPQCDDNLIERIIDRNANGKLESLAFCLGTNVNVASATDRTYFNLVGCKAKTVRVSASFNNEYIITVDFSVKSGTTATTATGVAPTDLTGDYLAFHVAGGITKDATDFAYIVDGIDVTIEHNLTDKWDHDSLVKQYCVEGALDATGTIDISLDEGGGVHWGEIMQQTEFDVIIDLGGSTCPRLTLPNCKWKSGEFDVNISGEPMMEDAPFTSHPSNAVECSNIVSATP
jgi:hypothetical protein